MNSSVGLVSVEQLHATLKRRGYHPKTTASEPSNSETQTRGGVSPSRVYTPGLGSSRTSFWRTVDSSSSTTSSSTSDSSIEDLVPLHVGNSTTHPYWQHCRDLASVWLSSRLPESCSEAGQQTHSRLWTELIEELDGSGIQYQLITPISGDMHASTLALPTLYSTVLVEGQGCPAIYTILSARQLELAFLWNGVAQSWTLDIAPLCRNDGMTTLEISLNGHTEITVPDSISFLVCSLQPLLSEMGLNYQNERLRGVIQRTSQYSVQLTTLSQEQPYSQSDSGSGVPYTWTLSNGLQTLMGVFTVPSVQSEHELDE